MRYFFGEYIRTYFISKEEITQAVKSLKYVKSGVRDGITTEMLNVVQLDIGGECLNMCRKTIKYSEK